MGDFNMTPNNPKLSELIDDHELCTLISEPTCFKSINPTCIDNFLTNKKTRFMKTSLMRKEILKIGLNMSANATFVQIF